MGKLIKAICSVDSPIVLVLEDLQWMDVESLGLLSKLIIDKSIKNLVLLGIYREKEIDSVHPVSFLLKEVRKRNIEFTSIHLNDLCYEQVNGLIANALCASPLDYYPLTAFVHEKTKGNSFFVKHMLK